MPGSTRASGVRHSAMHEAFARMIGSVAGWELVPEVSFSIYGERGVIDVLLWHPVARVLVVVELDGRAMAWLRRPAGRIAALSFMADGPGSTPDRRLRPSRRVRVARGPAADA